MLAYAYAKYNAMQCNIQYKIAVQYNTLYTITVKNKRLTEFDLFKWLNY